MASCFRYRIILSSHDQWILSDYEPPSISICSSSRRPTLEPPRARSTMISAADLEAAIRAAMPVIHLEIEDTSNGCGENYAVFVVSEVSPKCFCGAWKGREQFKADDHIHPRHLRGRTR